MAMKYSMFGCMLMMIMAIRVSEADKKIERSASGLYVFGDSTVDVGNNNLFKTFIKSDFAPYGVDFPAGSNGRPTNGFNMADFYAQWLGLDLIPAVRLINKNITNIFHGLNFASSASGISPKVGTNIFAQIINLGQQVDMFERFMTKMLPKRYQTQEKLSAHISKSIFLFVVGVNDINTIISTKNSTDPQAYVKDVDDIVWRLGSRLKYLYKLGARKFVVYEVEALGCLPFSVARHNKTSNSKCVDYMNSIARIYNEKLALKLRELQGTLGGSTFILGKYYDFTLRLVQNPSLYGIKDATNPCCTVLTFGVCEPMKPPCSDRNSHAFFDSFHPTQVTYKAFASRCFSGSGSCVPMNIRKLASL